MNKQKVSRLHCDGHYKTYVYTWTYETLQNGPKPFRINMESVYSEKYPIEVHLSPVGAEATTSGLPRVDGETR